MPFHLDEHVIVVQGAAHGLEFPDGWHTILLVTIFGRNQQSCTANQLVVSLIDNTLGAVSIEKVDGQEQGRWQ
jgi:hypothetical protein